MAKIPEYFATGQMETSRLPRAPMDIADTGQGLAGQAIAGLGWELRRTGQLLAAIETERQRGRDNVALAEMKGVLDDFEFQARPDPTKFKEIADFKKAEEKYGKDWQREAQRISKGANRQVGEQFQIYTELHRDTARKNYHNKSWPLEQNYALAQLNRLWSDKFQKFVNEPVKLKKELQSLIEQFDIYLKPTDKQKLEASIDTNIESYQIQSLINTNPESAMEAIDTSTVDERGKNILRSQARAAIARNERGQALQLQAMREKISNQMLVDYWNGDLTDPQKVTDALESGYLDDTDAKYLRNAMLNPDPPVHKLQAEAKVKQAIEDIGTNYKTKQEALSILYANVQDLDPTKASSMLNSIFAAQDKNKSEMKRESRSLMEELVRDRDKITGMFTDDERQILASAEAYLILDTEIQKAEEAGKPLERRDIMIKAIQIGRQMKKKIKAEEAAKKEPSFEPSRAEEIVEFKERLKGEKYYKYKESLREPQFEMTGGVPSIIYDEEGKEQGLKMTNKNIFKIGDLMIRRGFTYKYLGNHQWQKQ